MAKSDSPYSTGCAFVTKRFTTTPPEAAVSFHRGEDGEVTHLVLHQGGEQRARRLPDRLVEIGVERLLHGRDRR